MHGEEAAPAFSPGRVGEFEKGRIMEKGYQVIEPALLNDVLVLPRTFDITVAILSWLVEVLRTTLKERLSGAELEVIRVEYMGAYPAIGIHYTTDEGKDIGPIVEAAISELLHERTLVDFAEYLARTNGNWRKITDDMLGPRRLAP